MENKSYLLALNKIPSIGPRTIAKLLQKWPNLEELFCLTQQQMEQAGLSPRMAQSIKSFNFKEIEADLHWSEKTIII